MVGIGRAGADAALNSARISRNLGHCRFYGSTFEKSAFSAVHMQIRSAPS
jgi:hypothetical protein